MSRMLLILPAFILFLILFIPLARAQEPEATFEPICTSEQSKEECAMRRLNHGLMQPEQAKETTDADVSGWLTQIGQTLSGLVAFFTGADNLEDGYLPTTAEINETAMSEESSAVLGTTSDPEQELNGKLAGPDGYYGATLPTVDQLPDGIEKPVGDKLYIGPIPIPFTEPINQEEKYFEQSYFPQEICYADGSCETVCPITGKCAE